MTTFPEPPPIDVSAIKQQVVFISVVPADVNRLRFLPVETMTLIPKVTDLYTLVRCDRCRENAWMGPRQNAAVPLLKEMGRTVEVVCFACQLGTDQGIADLLTSPRAHLGGGYPTEGRPRTP